MIVPHLSPPFPISQTLLKDTKQQLDVQAGVIFKTISDWSSPILLVKKNPGPDGKQTYCLVLDLRLINTIIPQSAYPLPKIHDITQYKSHSINFIQNLTYNLHIIRLIYLINFDQF